MLGTCNIGPAWTGNVTWGNGEGTTTKFVHALSQSARTLQGLTSGPIGAALWIQSEDLSKYDRLGVFVRATKTAHTAAMNFSSSEVNVIPIWNDDLTPVVSWYPAGHFPTYADMGGGLNSGSRNLFGFNGVNKPIIDGMTNGASSAAVFWVSSNHFGNLIRPYPKVLVAMQFSPNTAIAGNNTWAFEFRFIYARD